MAHAFDTGLAAPQRTKILDGAIALLGGLKVANGGYLAAVVPFGAVVRSYTDGDGVQMLYEALSGSAPAVAIALGSRSSKPAGVGGFNSTAEVELLAYFLSNNMRDLATGRLLIDGSGAAADTADPGLHVMMEHVEELLVGQRCGASDTIKQVRPDREEELTTRDDCTIWLQTYQVTVTRSIKEWRTVTQLLESIRWRTTQEDGEVELPAAATKDTTIDVATSFVFRYTITKTAATSVFDSSAFTAAVYTGDLVVEFEPPAPGSDAFAVGISADNPNADYTGIDFGLLCDTGTMYRAENGVLTSLGATIAGDVWEIRRSIATGAVTYWKNGVLVSTSPATSVAPLLVDTSFRFVGDQIAHVNVNGAAEVSWTTVGVTATEE